SKKTELWRFINGLGIPLIGEKTAKDLATHFSSLGALMDATDDDLTGIRGIGIKAAKSIIDFFGREENRALIRRFLAKGLEFSAMTRAMNQKIAGKLFVLTGKLEKYTREQGKALIEQNGGSVANGITGKVDILIAGTDGGQKLQEARRRNITIWEEKDFDEALTS
ncbi:MAG: NAD-dependent DNA ligase LigA, partial [Puniceicoccales bacterium]|nr:NAD-dependent DNA ligase LigA [Puniceicoccales bacterium]